MRATLRLLAMLTFWASLTMASKAADWVESASGDLSNNRLQPSVLPLAPGTNTLRGGFGRGDLDYLTVVVPPGMQLEALRYAEPMVIGGVRAFIAVQAGVTMTVAPNTESAAGLLGWAHFQQALPGTDLLPAIGTGFGAIGFAGPLPSGTYTFWIQDTSFEPGLAYAFDLEVSAAPVTAADGDVPLPGWALLLLALGCAGRLVRRA